MRAAHLLGLVAVISAISLTTLACADTWREIPTAELRQLESRMEDARTDGAEATRVEAGAPLRIYLRTGEVHQIEAYSFHFDGELLVVPDHGLAVRTDSITRAAVHQPGETHPLAGVLFNIGIFVAAIFGVGMCAAAFEARSRRAGGSIAAADDPVPLRNGPHTTPNLASAEENPCSDCRPGSEHAATAG